MFRVVFFDPGGLDALVRAHLKARETGTEPHVLNSPPPVAVLLHPHQASTRCRG